MKYDYTIYHASGVALDTWDYNGPKNEYFFHLNYF